MPGCYDGLSAKLVADAGYKVTFMSGFAVSAARLGMQNPATPSRHGSEVNEVQALLRVIPQFTKPRQRLRLS